MRFKIASRIFDPEPSAASFRLGALASELTDAGHEVEVLTVRPPAQMADLSRDEERDYRVRRFPVLRDRSGYVRGYLPYLSFDIPLFFRILLGSRADAIVIEPPPTSGFFVRLAAALRRTPYIYYAADVWSDAAKLTGAHRYVLKTVEKIERWALNGACLVVAVSPGVEERLTELGVRAPIVMVGNGIDVSAFAMENTKTLHGVPLFVYGGTVAEWHGAEVFVRAMKVVQRKFPAARLRFIGGGSEKDRLGDLATKLRLRNVDFMDPMPAEELAAWLRVATASLASVRPGTAYEFAFPTKLYGSTVAGAPLIFAGGGPAVEFVQTEVEGAPLGEACDFSPEAVAEAMLHAIEFPSSAERREAVSQWGYRNVGLGGVAAHIRREIENAVRN